MWSAADIAVIQAFVEELETSPIFNKCKQRIKRGPHGAPFLWRPQDCDPDFSWSDLFLEILARFYTWNVFCDRRRKTKETPFTVLLELLVQWFETGGRCHIFGCRFTIFQNHLQSYSIGPAVYRLDSQGNQTDEFILPGSEMRTGCKPGMKSMTEYRYANRTVIMESWKANSLRWDYAVGPDLLPLLQQYVLALDDSGEYYEDFIPDAARYHKVDMGELFWSTGQGRRLAALLDRPFEDEELDEAGEGEEYEEIVEDDEEVEMWTAAVEEPVIDDDDNVLVPTAVDRARKFTPAPDMSDIDSSSGGGGDDMSGNMTAVGPHDNALVRSPTRGRYDDVIKVESQEEEFMMAGALAAPTPRLTGPIVISRPLRVLPEVEARLIVKPHLMWAFLLVFPSGNGYDVGYAATDHTYLSSEGTVLGYWRDDGDVFAADSDGVQGAFIKNVFLENTGA
jgi:hypothetical protein